MPKPPQISDFPQSIQQYILLHSPPNPRSLLIMLHGLGDSNGPLANLGKQVNLPSTAVLSIRGPSPIPALFMGSPLDGLGSGTGWHWGDDITLDQGTGELVMDSGFVAAGKVVGEVLKVVLGDPKGGGSAEAWKEENLGTSKPPGGGGSGFDARDVFLWGFGQGGTVALSLAEAMGTEIGGVVSIGGKIAASRSAMAKAVEDLSEDMLDKKADGKVKTPVLLCGGNRHTAVTTNVLRDVKGRFRTVEYSKWEREGDSMARNREEMLPIMKFLASRLRMSTPVGMQEVGGVSRG